MLTNLATLARNHLPDFVLEALPIVAALAGIVSVALLPLWWLARSVNVL